MRGQTAKRLRREVSGGNVDRLQLKEYDVVDNLRKNGENSGKKRVVNLNEMKRAYKELKRSHK